MTKKQLLKKLESCCAVVASIGGKKVIPASKLAKKLGADIIEVRIDDILRERNERLLCGIIRKVKNAANLPLIGTVRIFSEGGRVSLPEDKRLAIFLSIMDELDLVDIELRAGSINEEIIEKAHEKGKLIIVSYHNFRSTPPVSVLRKHAEKAVALGADIVKIAAMANKKKDAERLLGFCSSWKKSLMTAVSLGAPGKLSRTNGHVYGSCLAYGYVSHPFGPGQPSVKELRCLI